MGGVGAEVFLEYCVDGRALLSDFGHIESFQRMGEFEPGRSLVDDIIGYLGGLVTGRFVIGYGNTDVLRGVEA